MLPKTRALTVLQWLLGLGFAAFFVLAFVDHESRLDLSGTDEKPIANAANDAVPAPLPAPPVALAPETKREKLAAVPLLETQAQDAATGAALPSSPVPAPVIAQEHVALPLLVPPANDRERYDPQTINPVKRVIEEPVSTFSIDVDTASYANVRRMLDAGHPPPPDAVRIEELINYFDYDYPPPTERAVPFRVLTELTPSPFHARRHLLRIALKGYEVPPSARPAANLVFLIDVSGSMDSPDKLPLLQRAFTILTEHLRADDTIGIVTYAGRAGVVLEPTGDKHRILAAIEQLTPGGSTAGAAGIHAAYGLARAAFVPGGINRVILATDGDFNVGVTSPRALEQLVAEQRASGIGLTVLGFGTGNYNDALMERLSNVGDGNAYYIDRFREAQKVLVDEISSTLFTIARDVKIQIEFNPARVAEYRLIGFENRLLAREDFDNDRVDAGDIGAGHRVTALYELALVGSGGEQLPPSRYAPPSAPVPPEVAGELAYLKLRYKLPDATASALLEQALQADAIVPWHGASIDHRFAAAVAGFGQLLKDRRYLGDFGFNDVLRLAQDARGADPFGYRSEFLQLARQARGLAGEP